MFTVKIYKLKANAKIGISLEERSKKQPLLVSVKFSYDFMHVPWDILVCFRHRNIVLVGK